MSHPPTGHASTPRLDLSPSLYRTRGAHHRGQVLWQKRPGNPLLLLVVTTRGNPERVLGITRVQSNGAAPVPRPPLPAPEARDGVQAFLRTQEVTAVAVVHLVWLPPVSLDDPRGPRALSLARDLARPPPAPVAMDDHRPLPTETNTTGSPLSPPPGPHPAAVHDTAHGAPLMH